MERPRVPAPGDAPCAEHPAGRLPRIPRKCGAHGPSRTLAARLLPRPVVERWRWATARAMLSCRHAGTRGHLAGQTHTIRRGAPGLSLFMCLTRATGQGRAGQGRASRGWRSQAALSHSKAIRARKSSLSSPGPRAVGRTSLGTCLSRVRANARPGGRRRHPSDLT